MESQESIIPILVLLFVFLTIIWLLIKCVSSVCTTIWYSIFPRIVAIDTERVGIGYRGHLDMLARVSLVDSKGRVLLDKYVKPMHHVTDYRTPWSGIREKDLINGENYDSVQQKVLHILQTCNVLVGHDMETDLNILGLSCPRKIIRDTAYYMPFRRRYSKNLNEKLSLKFLALKVRGRRIQCGEHDSVEDARAAMDLYLSVAEHWETKCKCCWN